MARLGLGTNPAPRCPVLHQKGAGPFGPLPRLQPFLATDLSLAASGRSLVDHLVTGRRVGRADRNVGADLLELVVVNLAGVLDEVDHVLGVTGVAGTLDVRTLVRVVSRAG